MRRFVFLGCAFAAVVAVSFVASVDAEGPTVVAQEASPESVSYCHRSTSVVDPYVLETMPADEIIAQAHDGHAGPVFPAVGPDGQWGDIIPPFDNGQQQFPGLNWPAGSDVLEAGCAVYATIGPLPADSRTIEGRAVTKPNIVVNVSCRAQMNLDVTFNEEPPSPWTLLVFIDGVQEFTLVDGDSDLRGFHPVIPADQLPQVSYTYSVDATNAGQTFPAIAAGTVTCSDDPTTTSSTTTTTTSSTTTTTSSTTTTTIAPTTTIRPTTTTIRPTTTTSGPTTTIRPTTTTIRPTTTTIRPTTTTIRPTTTTSGPTTTTRPTTTTPSPTTVTTTSTTTTTTSLPGVTTTTVPTPPGTATPTTAPRPLNPPPVEALALDETLPDPPPRLFAFVMAPGNDVVLLGEYSPEQVRNLYRELAERRLAHTGDDTSTLALAALLSLLGGGALLGVARRRHAN